VEKFNSNYLLSLEVVDSAGGRALASAAEEAAGDSEVLPAVRRLSDWLRDYLGEEVAQISADGVQAEKVATPSLRAVELYSRGARTMLLGRVSEAEVLFRQAVEETPEFASANLFVFWALFNQGKGASAEARSFLEQAMELAGSASERERYFIEGSYHDFFARDYEKACTSYGTLAGLFPDHYWAAGNAAAVCGGKLGYRDDYVRYVVQAAAQRPEWSARATTALSLLEGDFDRARSHAERLGGMASELFAAEEYFHKGLLPDVLSELQRVQRALVPADAHVQEQLTWKLAKFYLALGQLQKAKALAWDHFYPGLFQGWCAFLEDDRAAFTRYTDDFRDSLRGVLPDPTERLIYMLRWNTWSYEIMPPVAVLAPLYDPGSAVEIVSSVQEPPFEFLELPAFKAKMQLARGKQLLDHGHPAEGIMLLESGAAWFRDYGDWRTFPHYFLGAELLATALSRQGDLQAAYRVLEDASGQRKLVNSNTAPQHQKIQARLALLARELGHVAEAQVLEAELREALSLADPDHPILVHMAPPDSSPSN